MQNLLVYAISPTHVISSLAAIEALHDQRNFSVVMVVYWPGATKELSEELGDVVKKLSRGFPYIKTVSTLSQDRFVNLVGCGVPADSASAIKEFIGNTDMHEIYYGHDVVGHLYQSLCAAYPDAIRICFGDALGNVYEREVHLSYLRGVNEKTVSKTTILGRMKQCFDKFFASVPVVSELQSKNYKPHKAALILPVDQSGNFLQNAPLTVIPKDIATATLEQCRASCRDLNDYVNTLLEETSNNRRHLLLTDNFAEGNFIDFDREVEMYCSIIREQCTPGSVIFLKSHPAETLPRNKRIGEKLAGEYKIVELDSKFKRYPIELWKDLVLNSTIICMSYPVLSLKYLYDIDVVQPMDHAFIEKWFPEWTWRSYKNSLSLYMEPLKNLATWDGKSVLWSGNIEK